MQTPVLTYTFHVHLLPTSFPATPPRAPRCNSNQRDVLVPFFARTFRFPSLRLTPFNLHNWEQYHLLQEASQLTLFCVSITTVWTGPLPEQGTLSQPQWCTGCLDSHPHHQTEFLECGDSHLLFLLHSEPWFFNNSTQAIIYAKINTAAFKWNPAFWFFLATPQSLWDPSFPN